MAIFQDIFLTDSIEIAVPCDQVFDFFLHMDQTYTTWHPKDHVTLRLINAEQVEVGAIAHCEQYIHGKVHKYRVEFTKVEPCREIEFRILPRIWRFFYPKGIFSFEPNADGGCRFTATEHIRMGRLGRKFGQKGVDSMKVHMKEEGENLKALMEGQGAET